jgi:hypothetical protein
MLTGCSTQSTAQNPETVKPVFVEGQECYELGKKVETNNESGFLECRYERNGNLSYVSLLGDTSAPYLSEGLQDINLCKLQDQRPLEGFASRMSGQNTAFPLTNTNIPPTGNVNVGIVPIDFSDSPAVKTVNETMGSHLRDIDNWLDFTTNGVTTYTWHMPENWLRMPFDSQNYKFSKQNIASDGSYKTVSDQPQSTEAMTTQIFTAAEQFINLQEMDYLWVVIPPTTKNVDWTVIGNFLPVSTPNNQYTLTFYGLANVLWNQHSQQVPIYAIMLHEMLHAHGASQHAPGNEYALHLGNSIGTIMGAWDSFIMGWRPDDAFACIDATSLGQIELELTPLDHNEEGYKAAFIRLSEKEILVVESRRKGPLSYRWVDGAAFVTAYIVDTSKLGLRFDGDNSRVKDYFSYYLEINEPHEKMLNYGQPLVNMMGPQFEYFSVRHVGLTGDVFEYGGISIEVTNQSDTDTVRISKID